MTSSSCDKALVVSMASLQRNVMLAIFGMNATDRTHLAEISIEMSLREIVQAEDATREQLAKLVKVVRERDVKRQRAQLTADLMKSRQLRETLCMLEKKRTGMEQQMNKLSESKLNMQMLQSMKHTNMALQNLGFKISDADAIMEDLEESNRDAKDMQMTLSSTFGDEDYFSQTDLEAELALMLGDDALTATRMHVEQQRPPARRQPETQAEPAVLVEMPQVAVHMGDKPDDPPAAGPEAEARAEATSPARAQTPARAEHSAETPQSLVAPASSMYAPKKTRARGARAAQEAPPPAAPAPATDAAADASANTADTADAAADAAADADSAELEHEPEPEPARA